MIDDIKLEVKKPILRKLIFSIGIPLLIVYLTVLVLNYIWGKNAALEQTKKYLIELTDHHAAVLDAEFSKITMAPIAVSEALETLQKPNHEQLISLVQEKMEYNPDIIGMAIAFEPYDFNSKKEFYAPYVFKENGNLTSCELSESYNYLFKDWYLIPKLLNHSYWSEPYFDVGGGNILMNTFSAPIYSKDRFIGIVTADMSLENLKARMDSVRIMGGYTFIISQHGTYIYHPNKKDIMRETLFSKAQRVNYPPMREFGRDMLKGNKAVTPFLDPIQGSKQWLVYTPIKSTGWTLAAIIPEKQILASVHSAIIRQSSVMLIGLLIISLVIIWASIGITKPIRKLVGLAEILATGNLDVQMENIKGEDEIHELALVFNKMVVDLKQHIKDLTETTKAKQAVESELKIARQIQESLLPRIWPAFPDREEFDLFAKNIPAKEVAGDFYDFFFLDDNTLAIIIADVSGKGIAAGLFMAVTRTLMKTVCQKGVEPADAVEKANAILCQDNDACMFTTLFLAIYSVDSGKFSFTNAGHNLPIILDKKGECKFLEAISNIAMGIDDEHHYIQSDSHLEVGDSLVLYTDGVTEATDGSDNLYGEERFCDKLKINVSNPVEVILNKIEVDLDKFQGEHQFDDITMLFIRRMI